MLSELDLAQKQPEAAQKRFEALLARKPDSAQAILGLARVKTLRGADKEEIAGLLRKAVEVAPNELLPRQILVAHHLLNQEP